MTYTEQIERSHRFKLALRMGLPIFFFSTLLLYDLFSYPYATIASLIALAILLLGVMVYYIFYLIYQSTQENITESTTHTFLPDYFFSLFDNARKEKRQTLMMIGIKNLHSINNHYGVRNGDEILRKIVTLVNAFFAAKGYTKLPLCRYKGGDFLLFFAGEKELYIPLVELFLAKHENITESEIEIRLEAVLTDTRLLDETEQLVERLYELRHEQPEGEKEEIYSIGELEKEIADALEAERISIGYWPVCCNGTMVYHTSVKLVDSAGKLIHQNRYVQALNRLNLTRRFETLVLETIGAVAETHNCRLIVDVSPVTMRNPHFFEQATTLFERYPNASHKVVMMFEEKEYCHQLERFRQLVSQYRKAGYGIAMDRLGGYHTTMLYLKELDIDLVRFDPLYSRRLAESGYQNLIQGLNLSAHLCGAETWIPMIEDEESDRLAQSLKINYREGNYHGSMMTLDQLKEKNHEIR